MGRADTRIAIERMAGGMTLGQVRGSEMRERKEMRTVRGTDEVVASAIGFVLEQGRRTGVGKELVNTKGEGELGRKDERGKREMRVEKGNRVYVLGGGEDSCESHESSRL